MHLGHVTRETGHTRRAPLREFSDKTLDDLYPILRRALSSARPYAIWDAHLYRGWYYENPRNGTHGNISYRQG